MKILITGANGFIGRALCKKLSRSCYDVSAVVRKIKKNSCYDNIRYYSIGDFNKKKNWKDLVTGVDCVIHCAAKAHITSKSKKHTLKSYRLINCITTKKLATQCGNFGVKRFIFLSSIGVLGNSTNRHGPFKHSDKPSPKEDYAISKFEAEQELFKISKMSGLEVVVLRPPLVYGALAPGNLMRLINLVRYRLPLPFSLVKNKRSFIGIDNLVDILIHCIEHPDAKGKSFLVSDDDDVSTPDLIKKISQYLGIPSLLFPIPIFFLKFISFIIRRKKEIDKLTDSLQVDISYTKKILSWVPPVGTDEGIRRIFLKD